PTGDSPPRASPIPSGTGCSSVGPPRGHKSCQQTCSSVGSSLHGATGPARSLLQHGLPTAKCSVPSGEKVEETEQPSDIEEGGLDLSVSLKPVSFYIADKKEMLQQCFCVIGEKKLQKMLPDILKVLKYTYCLYTFYKLECLCNKARLSLKFSGLPGLTGLEHTLFESCEWQDLVKVNRAGSLYRRRGCR
uniref:Caspase activity and apoptosis inhibitor 1 n=1 Tax=Otus sunia TaxID=257818 RepID=A0A8C8E4F2_9STRI